MCGINGIIATRAVNIETVKTMNAALTHRGPDGSGIFISPNQHVVLGHTRLAIIDLQEHARQPMLTEHNQHILVFNGEIYNYLELKKQLMAWGYRFETSSDTEVILRAYAAWGVDCLKHFNGMFAFCLIDLKNHIAFCARDRFGEKPFLFFHHKDFFVFSSEYKALFTLQEIDVKYDVDKLLTFLNASYDRLDNERDTVFDGVQQLLPAERMIVQLKTLEKKIERYWHASESNYSIHSEEDAQRSFKELLVDSTRLRLRSDVKIGSCLSGGLDSTAIVSIVRELEGNDFPYHTFTGRFPGTSADEWIYAQHVVNEKQVISHVTEPTAKEFVSVLPAFMYYNELPVGSASQFAQWKVFELAKQTGVTVLLDGQGADELLGGYEQYFQFYLSDIYSLQQFLFYRKEYTHIKTRYPLALLKMHQKIMARFPKFFLSILSRCTHRGSSFLFGLHDDVVDRVRDVSLKKIHNRGHLQSALYQDSFHNTLTTLLRYGDRNAMAHSREVRLPFCDHRIAELLFHFPPTWLMGGAQTKRILRNSLSGLLPERIQHRWNKQGFLPPQAIWFRQELGVYVEQILHQPEFLQRGFWNVKWWQQALCRIKNGDDAVSTALWRMMIGESWLNDFVKPMQLAKKYSLWKHL